MKTLRSLSILVAALALSSPVLAQSATKNVEVNATLTSVCLFDTATAIALTAAYTAFSGTAVEPTDTVNVQCTRGTSTPAIVFAGGTVGTVGGLVYELSAAYTGTTAGTAPAGSLISDVGTPRTGSFVVKASFPAGQAGTNGINTAVVKQMTLTY